MQSRQNRLGRLTLVITVWYAALGGLAFANIDAAGVAYGQDAIAPDAVIEPDSETIIEPDSEAVIEPDSDTVIEPDPEAVLDADSRNAPASGHAPFTIANAGHQASLVNEAISLQVAGRTPNGAAVMYSAAGLPPGILLTTSTGFLTGRPSTAGTYPVVVTISDGVVTTTTAFTWTVTGDPVTAPTPLSPIGTIASDKPAFAWYPGRGAVSYVLVVEDSAGVERIRATMSAADARCNATKRCTVSPAVWLPPGVAHWTVQTVAGNGDGPWSVQGTFTVPDKAAPTIQVTTPSTGAYETIESSMNLTGTASDNTGVASLVWFSSRGGGGIASGTTRWNATVPLQAGINRITVTARDTSGNAARASVTVVYVVPPTPLSPSGVSASAPGFVWTAVPATSRYVLRVNDSTHADTVLMNVTPFEAGCESGPTCTFNPGVALAAGASEWSVEAIALSDLNAWSRLLPFTVDATLPTIQIFDRSHGKQYSTSSGEIRLSGLAGDDLAIARVVWSDDRGRGGIAAGTSQWTTDTIALRKGTTTFVVAAVDADGQSASDTITVTYTPDATTLRRR